MADLPETPGWEAGIKQLEQDDMAEGGRGGIANLQAVQLANRTLFLKLRVDGFRVGETPYASVSDAQLAFNNGDLSEGAVLSIRSLDPNVWTTEYKVENGMVVLNLDEKGRQKDLSTKLFTDGFFYSSNDDEIVGGFIDDNDRLPIFFNSKGQLLLGENNVNVNIALNSLFSNVNELNDTVPFYREYIQNGGFVDDDGFLPLYFNEKGEVILGDGDVNLSDFVKGGGGQSGDIESILREIHGNKKYFYFLGDSLTAGAGAPGNGYVEQLATELQPLGFTLTKNAVGGQGSAAIATRHGAYVNQLTLMNNAIPTSGVVTINSSTQMPITNQGGGPISGSLNGVPGVVSATFDSGGNMTSYVFNRSVPGDIVFVDNATPFIPTYNGHDYDISVFWYGRNDVKAIGAKDIIINALQASINHLKAQNRKFLVLSVLNGDYSGTEAKGSPLYNTIIDINETIKARWPRDYVEVRKPLVLAYDSNNPIDAQNFIDDIPPSSLRADGIHLNAAGYKVVKNCVKNAFKQRGWI